VYVHDRTQYGRMTQHRLTLQDAAQELGITPDALRQRIGRGQYHSTKEDGRVYVFLNLHRTKTEHDVQGEPTPLISALEDLQSSQVVDFKGGGGLNTGGIFPAGLPFLHRCVKWSLHTLFGC
jgi:hypothetical protein